MKPPDHGAVPPLVRWGSAAAGPYTWPATDTASLGVNAPVVSLPAANATGGLLAWAALAHETAGHDVLAADEGLRDELARGVRDGLLAGKTAPAVADYWADRMDETAADVLGVLNMGPAAAVGLVGYFRAANGAWNGTASLRNVGRRRTRTRRTSSGPTSRRRRCGSCRSTGRRAGRTGSWRRPTGTSGRSGSATSR